MRFMLILVAAGAVYLSIHTMKRRGIEPGTQDFWVCLLSPFAAGASVVVAPTLKKKAKI